MFLIVSCGVNRTHIEYSFPVRIVESLIGEGQRTHNNQQNPGQRNRFHVVSSAMWTGLPNGSRAPPTRPTLDVSRVVICSLKNTPGIPYWLA